LKKRLNKQNAPWKGRILSWKKPIGIRYRIFICFVLFTALLLVLLWLFQIVFLDDFYRFQKQEMLRSSTASLIQNIDNANLQTLAQRLSEENHLCILITDENMRELIKAEAWNGCIIHHMNRIDLLRIASSVRGENKAALLDFPLSGFRNQQYDARNFRGRVPPSDDGSMRSMVMVQKFEIADRKNIYLFLNTLITPVNATVQTIRNELVFITVILICKEVL